MNMSGRIFLKLTTTCVGPELHPLLPANTRLRIVSKDMPILLFKTSGARSNITRLFCRTTRLGGSITALQSLWDRAKTSWGQLPVSLQYPKTAVENPLIERPG